MSPIFSKLDRVVSGRIVYFLNCSLPEATDSRKSDLPTVVRGFNGSTVKLPETGDRVFMFRSETDRDRFLDQWDKPQHSLNPVDWHRQKAREMQEQDDEFLSSTSNWQRPQYSPDDVERLAQERFPYLYPLRTVGDLSNLSIVEQHEAPRRHRDYLSHVENLLLTALPGEVLVHEDWLFTFPYLKDAFCWKSSGSFYFRAEREVPLEGLHERLSAINSTLAALDTAVAVRRAESSSVYEQELSRNTLTEWRLKKDEQVLITRVIHNIGVYLEKKRQRDNETRNFLIERRETMTKLIHNTNAQFDLDNYYLFRNARL